MKENLHKYLLTIIIFIQGGLFLFMVLPFLIGAGHIYSHPTLADPSEGFELLLAAAFSLIFSVIFLTTSILILLGSPKSKIPGVITAIISAGLGIYFVSSLLDPIVVAMGIFQLTIGAYILWFLLTKRNGISQSEPEILQPN